LRLEHDSLASRRLEKNKTFFFRREKVLNDKLLAFFSLYTQKENLLLISQSSASGLPATLPWVQLKKQKKKNPQQNFPFFHINHRGIFLCGF
jgi:hypothetical protein